MIIEFVTRGGFSPKAFEDRAIPLKSSWLNLMIETASAPSCPHDSIVWTDELGDLIAFGEWLIKSPVCPINVRVLINGVHYLYGPDGNLYRCEEYVSGPETIDLSAYRESK